MSDPATAARRKTADSLSQVLTPAVQRRVGTANAKPEEAITANPVYQIMMSDAVPEQKRSSVAAFLTFPGTREEAKARITAFAVFEEYLQTVREEMAQKIISLTDTEAFSELQGVYQDLNGALLDFDEKMRPLTEIIDALYTLRTNDKVLDAYREIKTDKQREAERERKLQEKSHEFMTVRTRIQDINGAISVLGESRSMFGWGGVKQTAREQIAREELALKEVTAQLDQLQAEIATLEHAPASDSALGEFAAQKDGLKKLLDLTSDEHKKQQRDLVDAALNFVNLTKQRVGSIRQHLGDMDVQIERVYDTNQKLTGVHAVLGEGLQQAEEANKAQRAALAPSAEESLIQQMARSNKEEALLDHIKGLQTAAATTVSTYGDLVSQAWRVRTMREANQNQVDKARIIGSQGIAGVADRLSTVLNAVSAAALGEASEMSRDTLAKMMKSTGAIAHKESIRVAMGVGEINDDLTKAIDMLGESGEVLRTQTHIAFEGLKDMRANIEKIRGLAEDVRHDIHDNAAAAADVANQTTPDAAAPAPPPKMFGGLR